MSLRGVSLFGVALALGLTLSVDAFADVSREQATQAIEKRYGAAARVVRADVIEQNGHRIYVFRLLSGSGKVWIVRIDAQTGAEIP